MSAIFLLCLCLPPIASAPPAACLLQCKPPVPAVTCLTDSSKGCRTCQAAPNQLKCAMCAIANYVVTSAGSVSGICGPDRRCCCRQCSGCAEREVVCAECMLPKCCLQVPGYAMTGSVQSGHSLLLYPLQCKLVAPLVTCLSDASKGCRTCGTAPNELKCATCLKKAHVVNAAGAVSGGLGPGKAGVQGRLGSRGGLCVYRKCRLTLPACTLLSRADCVMLRCKQLEPDRCHHAATLPPQTLVVQQSVHLLACLPRLPQCVAPRPPVDCKSDRTKGCATCQAAPYTLKCATCATAGWIVNAAGVVSRHQWLAALLVGRLLRGSAGSSD